MLISTKRWVRRSPDPEQVPPSNPPAPEYELETVQLALQAAGDVDRYDVGQQIVEAARSDLCVVCAKNWAESTVVTSAGHEVQVCSECAQWDIP